MYLANSKTTNIVDSKDKNHNKNIDMYIEKLL
jgi:hypothetical protein